MESQPQNSEFRNNPENFHPCALRVYRGQFYYARFDTAAKKLLRGELTEG